MSYQKFQTNSYCVGRRHCSGTVRIESDITKTKLVYVRKVKEKNQWLLVMITEKLKD